MLIELFVTGMAPSPGLQLGAVIIGFAIAIILHEVSHGYVALMLGDPTAKYAGRLTLNPIAHVDLWGTIIIPLLLIASQTGIVFGWAKPVPVNEFNLRKGKWGPVIVALAGPATNFILLAIFGLLARLTPAGTALPYLFATIAFINSILMFFNIIPIPPLDGSKVLYLFLEHRQDIKDWLERWGILVLLAVLVVAQGFFEMLVFTPASFLVSFFAGISPY